MIELKIVPAGKLFLLDKRAAPGGNSRSSPLLGATSPNQLAAVVQLSFVPPPSQVRSAPSALGKMHRRTPRIADKRNIAT